MSRTPVHRRSVSLGLLTPLIPLALLAGCGGGGSTGGEEPPPAKLSFTLSGKVTDGPIANAAVTASVGDQSFTTTADANGNYQLLLEVDPAAAARFVSLTAAGSGAQSHVKLTSLLGSFQTLDTQAGAANTLARAQNPRVNVTNVSTAEAVLMVEANGGSAIASDAALEQFAAGLEGQSVLDLATALKLLIDDAASFALPEGVTDTLQFAGQATVREQFISDAIDSAPESFQAAQNSIAADPELVTPVSAASLPSRLLAATVSTDPGFSFNYSNRLAGFTFAANNTGTVFDSYGSVATTWALEGSGVVVQYAQPRQSVSYDYVDCDGSLRQVETLYTSTGVRLALLGSRTLTQTETYALSYPGCEGKPDASKTVTAATTVLDDDAYLPLAAADFAGGKRSLLAYDSSLNGAPLGADLFQFNADGSGSTSLMGKSFTWAVNGRSLEVNFGSGVSARYHLLRDFDGISFDAVSEFTTGDGELADASVSIKVDPERALSFAEASVPARYYLFGPDTEEVPGSTLKGFRLRFDAGGTGSQEDEVLNEQGEPLLYDESNTPYYAFRWTLESGNLAVRRTYSTANGAANCVAGSANCVLFDERLIQPLMLAGTRHYWIESRRLNNAGVGEQTPRTLLARFYDREALPEAAADAKSANTALRVGRFADRRQRD